MSGGIAEAIIGLIMGMAEAGISIDQNTRNIHAMRNSQNLQRMTYLLSLLREDTAVQRRVKDLTAAGLSPTLAAGSAATTMPALKVDSIKHNLNLDLQNQFQNAMNLRNQTQLINAQVDNVSANADRTRQLNMQDLMMFPDKLQSLKKHNILTDQQAELLRKRIKQAVLDYNYQNTTGFKAGVPRQASGTLVDLQNILNSIQKPITGVDSTNPDYESGY